MEVPRLSETFLGQLMIFRVSFPCLQVSSPIAVTHDHAPNVGNKIISNVYACNFQTVSDFILKLYFQFKTTS